MNDRRKKNSDMIKPFYFHHEGKPAEDYPASCSGSESKGRLKEKPFSHNKEEASSNQEYSLILYNDEVNSFDHVIESLMEICNHSSVQAEQCTMIAHHKGHCEVKKGQKKILKDMQMGLIDRGLKASID